MGFILSHGQGGLACCNSWGRKESDMTERLKWADGEHTQSTLSVALKLPLMWRLEENSLAVKVQMCSIPKCKAWLLRQNPPFSISQAVPWVRSHKSALIASLGGLRRPWLCTLSLAELAVSWNAGGVGCGLHLSGSWSCPLISPDPQLLSPASPWAVRDLEWVSGVITWGL